MKLNTGANKMDELNNIPMFYGQTNALNKRPVTMSNCSPLQEPMQLRLGLLRHVWYMC
jgi:hypothetical protein